MSEDGLTVAAFKRAGHRAIPRPAGDGEVCRRCGFFWPCGTLQTAAEVDAHLAATLDAAREDVARALYEAMYGIRGFPGIGWADVYHDSWGRKADRVLGVIAARLTPTDGAR